jgi:hypothetical protein
MRAMTLPWSSRFEVNDDQRGKTAGLLHNGTHGSKGFSGRGEAKNVARLWLSPVPGSIADDWSPSSCAADS